MIKADKNTPLTKPDILTVASQYTTLRRIGAKHIGLCPLHPEKTPSFFINPSKQTFACYGCNTHGDVLDLVQKINSCDFKFALSILGISNDRPYKPDPLQIRKRELEQSFRAWCSQYYNELAAEYRLIHKALRALKNTDCMGSLYKQCTNLEFQMNILHGRDDAAKLELYRAVKQRG